MKSRFTKKQRHEIYMNALDSYNYDRSCSRYMCDHIAYVVQYVLNDDNYSWADVPYDFPEFMRKKPINIKEGNGWFNPRYVNVRREILKQCILETSKQ